MAPNKIRILGGFGIFLLIILLAFEALPLMPNNTLNVFSTVALQRTLGQRVAKNALVLAYRSYPDERAEAVSELQNVLPYWEKVQNGLQNGDPSLGIPARLPPDISLIVAQSQPDFAYMDTAAHKVLANPSSVDPVQISIILQHDNAYFLAMVQITNLMQQNIQSAYQMYFIIELGIGVVLMAIWIVFILSVKSALGKVYKGE
jgi:hypothetical protein